MLVFLSLISVFLSICSHPVDTLFFPSRPKREEEEEKEEEEEEEEKLPANNI